MKPKIGVVGAGRLGTALARAFVKSDFKVAIVNSRGPESLQLQLQIILPGAQAMEIHRLIDWADVIILAIPLRRYRTLPLTEMSGKIVIDAMNYWAPVDGEVVEFDAYAGSSSELIARSLAGARVVKSLNSVAYNEIEEHALERGSQKRRAIAMAGDDTDAKVVVSYLIDAIGFDAVDVGELKNGVLFQPDTRLFNARFTAQELRKTLDVVS